jgi:hypothetical protein
LCLIKGVGDGSSILVWEDPWIPSNLSKQPLVRLPDTEMNMVQELIDDHLNSWNSEKVIENFIPIDTAAICRIPIGRFLEDSWAWTDEKNGCFSVLSCYRLLASRNEPLSSSGEVASMHWRNLRELFF